MKLTNKELEVMSVLWDSTVPMTASEIIEASANRTWKESSIYIIMNTLTKKGAVILAQHKSSEGGAYGRAYVPTITAEEYADLSHT